MGKNIIICCDGTDNKKIPGKEAQWTNVAKLHESLWGDDVTNALYIPGIGTRGFIERGFGPTLGYGIEQNIKDAYKHICKLYTPYKDHIYLFGFSRGAYTVRSLAGFVRKVGLLLKQSSDALIEQAYSYYWLGDEVGDDEPLKKFLYDIGVPTKLNDNQRVLIYFIGVWDSVAALGPPGSLGKPVKRWVTYHQVELPDHVKYAYQALALHELREYFAPVFWSKKNVGQILEQVWFAGAHADVGGGYDDRRVLPLADIALMWMQHKAYNADSTTQRLKIPVGAGISKQTPSPKQYQPHNTIKGWFRWSTPTSRHLFRDEYANDALGGVWETIKLHQSVQQYWGNTTARDYEYSIKAVNKQLRKIDDRSLQFHLEQFSKYGIGFATD